ncbi:hypothetical protein L7F22_030370 [Adiantum nelumboides]|nr:hypothetical protein [Adiantum nelumboides]
MWNDFLWDHERPPRQLEGEDRLDKGSASSSRFWAEASLVDTEFMTFDLEIRRGIAAGMVKIDAAILDDMACNFHWAGDDLALFVKQNLLPRVNIMSSESLRTLREDGRPIALAILDNDSSEQSVSFIKKLKAAAPANRAFLFAYVDWRKWPSFVDSFNIDLKPGVPAFIVWNGDSTYFLSGENYDFGGERADSYITFFLQEYKEGRAKQLNMKGPSFRDFIWSLFSMRSVYILVLIAAVFFLAQSMLSSDSADGRAKQLHHEDYDDGLETHRSPSSHPVAEGSFDSPHGTIKED